MAEVGMLIAIVGTLLHARETITALIQALKRGLTTRERSET
jgi:hypothetical protein